MVTFSRHKSILNQSPHHSHPTNQQSCTAIFLKCDNQPAVIKTDPFIYHGNVLMSGDFSLSIFWRL
jgi:hypothetical protein